MKIIERIIRGIFLFLFGLTTGGLGMWFITIDALKSGRNNNRADCKISYRDYYSNRKDS